MLDFIETITDSRLKSRLEKAIEQKKPFAHFKDVIKGSDEVQKWYGFSSDRHYDRVIKWLTLNNINLPNESIKQ